MTASQLFSTFCFNSFHSSNLFKSFQIFSNLSNSCQFFVNSRHFLVNYRRFSSIPAKFVQFRHKLTNVKEEQQQQAQKQIYI